MTYAKNGAAIIDGNVVPRTELMVLEALVGLGKNVSVPEIALAIGEKISDASLYTLLGRLREKRGLVDREDVMLDVLGRPVRRVVWHAHQAATDFFKKNRYEENAIQNEGAAMAS